MIQIGISTVVAWTIGAFGSLITLLVVIVGGLLRRELRLNDRAHENLRNDIKAVDSDVKKLLSGDVAWVKSLLRQ
jgi:hypothetical protein